LVVSISACQHAAFGSFQHVALRATSQHFSLSALPFGSYLGALCETASRGKVWRALQGNESRCLADRLMSRLAKPGGVLKC
jgi:hypothetical protein